MYHANGQNQSGVFFEPTLILRSKYQLTDLTERLIARRTAVTIGGRSASISRLISGVFMHDPIFL